MSLTGPHFHFALIIRKNRISLSADSPSLSVKRKKSSRSPEAFPRERSLLILKEACFPGKIDTTSFGACFSNVHFRRLWVQTTMNFSRRIRLTRPSQCLATLLVLGWVAIWPAMGRAQIADTKSDTKSATGKNLKQDASDKEDPASEESAEEDQQATKDASQTGKNKKPPTDGTENNDEAMESDVPENPEADAEMDEGAVKPIGDLPSKDGESTVAVSDLIKLGEYRKAELVIGVKITSSGLCQNIHATIPMPMDFPEQKVRLISTNFPVTAKYYVRPLSEGVQQLVIDIPNLAANSTMEATIKLEVEKAKILGPTNPESLVIPKKITKQLNQYMGNSPMIESSNQKIRKIAREIAATNPPNAWTHVERIYDKVRELINYREGKAKSILTALHEKEGDCEELSGAFVAICRASKIPARCVWVYGHAYPEFYLEDDKGNGCWFPCQVAGTRQFGTMDEVRPILQKGDRFKVPEKTQTQRYVAEYLKVKAVVGGDGPDVEFIKDVVEK